CRSGHVARSAARMATFVHGDTVLVPADQLGTLGNSMQATMSKESPPDATVSRPWRWLVWSVFAAVWTAALLTPHPPELAGEILPEGLATGPLSAGIVFPAFKLP